MILPRFHLFIGFWTSVHLTSRIAADDVMKESTDRQPCHIRDQPETGFCVASDQLAGQCDSRNAFIRQSKDCSGSDDWCCLLLPVIRQGPDVAHRVQAEGKGIDSVDLAPCGHGNIDRKFAPGSALSSVRQFARVFQGAPTVDGDMCWVGAILDKNGMFVCTGTILNSTHIMTAGHCVDRYLLNPENLSVETGVTIAQPISQGVVAACAQKFDVVEIILPGRYDPVLLLEDHALLRIRGSIRADECSCRVCLPNRDAIPELSGVATCWVAGFGATREGGGGSLQLNKSPIQFVRRDRCTVLLGGMLTAGNQRFPLSDSAFCAGDAQQGGLCTHDGGAPLTCIIGGRHTLVGIGSWSVDCSKYPSVFSNIAACSDFLHNFNAPCDPVRSVLRGAVALTDLQMNGGPSCGIPGDGTIDPFLLANQSPSQQQQDVASIKKVQQSILDAMSANTPNTKMAVSTEFKMLQENGVMRLTVDPEAKLEGVNSVSTTIPPVRPIVGGMPSPLNEVCWQVLLSTGCGGSIIADQFILTAAHCVTIRGTTQPRRPETIRVILGATSSPVKFPLTDCQDIARVRRVVVHENYFLGNDTALYVANDIAILELEKPIDFSTPCVCRMCLQTNEPVPGELCSASGFGCQVPTAPNAACADRGSRQLMSLRVIMPGDDVCSAFFSDFPRDRVTCSASRSGQAPCFGDSGGPLVCYNNEKKTHYQAGVTSFAVFPDGVQECGNGQANFQYYTKVNGFIGWIQATVPDVMVAEPTAFNFHASFNIDLGKGVSSIISNNQLLPTN